MADQTFSSCLQAGKILWKTKYYIGDRKLVKYYRGRTNVFIAVCKLDTHYYGIPYIFLAFCKLDDLMFAINVQPQVRVS